MIYILLCFGSKIFINTPTTLIRQNYKDLCQSVKKPNNSRSEPAPKHQFYYPTSDFIDGSWNLRRQKLIPTNNLGSIIDPRDIHNNDEMRKLASIHSKNSYSTGDVEKDVIINRYNYLKNQFQWLEQFIPEIKLKQIIELMAYSRTERKLAKNLEGMNLRDLALILAFWQLDAYSSGNYIVEEVLQEINDYLKTFSNGFCLRGHITVKDIQLAEESILHDLYSIEYKQKTHNFQRFPQKSLQYYRNFLHSFEDSIPEEFAKKIMKARKLKNNLVIPGSVYIWVIRNNILKQLLPFLATRANLSLKRNESINQFVDTFWTKVFHQKAVGDLSTIGYLILETWSEFHTPEVSINISDIHMPSKYKTRIKAYRRRFKDILVNIINNKAVSPKAETKTKSEIKSETKIIQNETTTTITVEYLQSRSTTDVIQLLNAIERWLEKFETVSGQKLLTRSKDLQAKFNQNKTYQSQINIFLQSKDQKKQEQYNKWCQVQYLTFQTKINELRSDAYMFFQEILSEEPIGIDVLFTLEEIELPHLKAQMTNLVNPLHSQSIDNVLKKIEEPYRIKADRELMQYNEFLHLLQSKLTQKIEQVLDEHVQSDPLKLL